MRATVPAVMLLAISTLNAGRVLAYPAPDTGATPPPSSLTSSIVVAPFFQRIFEDLLSSSATLRTQYDRIVSTPRVRVWVEPIFGPPGESRARATISRSTSGLLLARVEVATPLRIFEYAEMLAHEFEHVLEQIEGINLSELADGASGAAHRLVDGGYETERARLAGRAAALEVEQGTDLR